MNAQLPLALRWPAHQRLSAFVPGPNAAALDLVARAAALRDPASLYLHGATGSGRTHLLIAACAEASEEGHRAQYVATASLRGDRAQAIRGFGGSDLLAIDDVDALAGDDAAEHALFDLYNRCRAEGTLLLFAASAAPAQTGFRLPDLVSRLQSCTQLVLRPLDEVERRAVIEARARARGLELDKAALDWLFTRRRRDLVSLLAMLERIDAASLAAKRRVTVPFLREVLGEAAAGNEPA